MDLHSQVRKLVNFLKSHSSLMFNIAAIITQQQQQQQQTNQTTDSTSSPESSKTPRRVRGAGKHLLSSSSSSGALTSPLNSTASAASFYQHLSNTLTDPLVELTGSSELAQLYMRYRLVDAELAPKYTALQHKEVEMIKNLRRLNRERVSMLHTIAQSLIDYMQLQQQQQQPETTTTSTNETTTENGKGEETTAAQNDTAADTSANVINKLRYHPIFNSTINFKCCACPKSILKDLAVKKIKQCQLCYGLFHGNLVESKLLKFTYRIFSNSIIL